LGNVSHWKCFVIKVDKNKVCATFWVIFSKKHLVTLLRSEKAKTKGVWWWAGRGQNRDRAEGGGSKGGVRD
jgi:hypothetical protein